MYRIIRFKNGKGKTLARFQTEDEVASYHSLQGKNQLEGGESTKKHCIVEFERGSDHCKLLAQFDTPEESANYYEKIKDKYDPFGPHLVLTLELQPGGDYDDLQRKPQYRQNWGKKPATANTAK